MLSFISPLEVLISSTKEQKSIRQLLRECERHYEVSGPPLDLNSFMEDLYLIKRKREQMEEYTYRTFGP